MSTNCLAELRRAIAENLEKARDLKALIKAAVEQGSFDIAREKIKEYKGLFPNDVEILSVETVMYIAENDLEAAEKYALEGLEKVPFYFDLNYNLGCIYQMSRRYQEAINAFSKAVKVAVTDEEKTVVMTAIKQVTETHNNVDTSKIHGVSHKLFPLRTKDDTWIGKPLFEDTDGKYIPLYYKEYDFVSFSPGYWYFYVTETLKGEFYENKAIRINVPPDTVIPLALLGKTSPVKIRVENKDYILNDLVPNRYYYFPIRQAAKVTVKCNDRFILGKPIPLTQGKQHEVRLVLNLFIDGLSQEILAEYSLAELMPHTWDFFKQGTIFTNCYCNAEWTLASVPSMFTGKYVAAHKIFHPELPHVVGERHQTINSRFQAEGYLTFQRCGNWRKTPAYGYVKGFDRTLYQSAVRDSLVMDVVSDFLEHMRSFPNRDHFIWLSFFELHHVNDDLDLNISSQIANSLEARITGNDNVKSVNKRYDKNKRERYINEIKRLDYYFKIIYDFIQNNYSDEEILVVLCSDHGQSFLDQDPNLYKESRAKVPLMVRGRGIPAQVSDELIENVDLVPIVLSICGMEFEPDALDGKIPISLGGKQAKESIVWESLYPNKTYKAVIREQEHTLIFESGGNVGPDGRFCLGDFTLMLKNNLTGRDESDRFPEKTAKLLEKVLAHVTHFIKVD